LFFVCLLSVLHFGSALFRLSKHSFLSMIICILLYHSSTVRSSLNPLFVHIEPNRFDSGMIVQLFCARINHWNRCFDEIPASQKVATGYGLPWMP
jgi:hypothetical protein